MMGHSRAAAVLGLCLLLTGCATQDMPSRWSKLPADQRATMFGTVSADLTKGALSRYMIKFRNVDTKEEAWFSIYPGHDRSGDPELYERGRTVGVLFDLTLPPGRYEFFDIWMVAATGFGSTEWKAKTPFSVPFTIEPNTVNYLGELRAYMVLGKNIFGMTAPGGAYWVVRDQETRDTAIFTKRRGGALSEPVRKIVLEVERGDPFMRRTPLPPYDASAQN